MDGSDQKLLKDYPWLNVQLFENILQEHHLKNSITERVIVKSAIVKRALQYGENYGSQLMRANVIYSIDSTTGSTSTNSESPSTGLSSSSKRQNKEISFIIKASLANNPLGEASKAMKVFEKEFFVYDKILQRVDKMLQSVGEYVKLSPKCYKGSAENHYLILEDLCESGYRNTSRAGGLDMDHYKLMLTKVAKLHAATACLLEREPELFKQHDQCVFASVSQIGRRFTSIFIATIHQVLKTLPGYETISAKLTKIMDSYMDRIINAYHRTDQSFNCFVHSDLWCNNIMYTYDENDRPTDAQIVDYQISYAGPAVIDLSYTLFTSSADTLFDPEWDLLIGHYYAQLVPMLKRLKYPKAIPSLVDIQCQFLKHSVASSSLGLLINGTRHYDKANVNTNKVFFEDAEEDRQTRFDIITSPGGRKRFDFLIDYYDRKGLFD